MKRLILFGSLVLWAIVAQPGRGQALGQIQWQQSFGGTGYDSLRSLREIPEGGYILAGFSDSSTNGNKTSPNFGGFDYWVIRIDASGQKLWERTYGGTNADMAYTVALTSDRGFIVGGESFSVTNGNKTSPNFGGSDYWVIRLDSAGNKLWEATFGGIGDDVLSSVQQASDEGFILGGSSFSPADGNKSSTNYGGSDVWLVRLDSSGNKLWETSYGGTGNETNLTIEVTGNDGFIFGAISSSGASGNKTNLAGGAWVVRLDNGGHKLLEQIIFNPWTYYTPISMAMRPILNDEFLVGSLSYYDPCGGVPCPQILLLLARLDATGNQVWSYPYFYSYLLNPPPNLASVLQTGDGGFVTGHTPPGAYRYFMMRAETSGNAIWFQQFGSSGFDYQRLFCLEGTRDGGFILGGDSAGPPSGDKTSPDFGSVDFWIVKLFPEQSHLELLPTTNDTERLRFSLQTSYLGTYVFERSTNLTTWQSWQTNSFTGNTLVIADRETNQTSQQFYRATRLP